MQNTPTQARWSQRILQILLVVGLLFGSLWMLDVPPFRGTSFSGGTTGPELIERAWDWLQGILPPLSASSEG